MAELSQVCQACARVKYFDSQSFADIIAAVKAKMGREHMYGCGAKTGKNQIEVERTCFATCKPVFQETN